MFDLNKLYSFREKIPKNLRKIFPKPLRRLINQMFFRYYYLSLNLKKLPSSNYPDEESFEYQKKLIEQFDLKKKQTSFMTYPNLTKLLLEKFDTNDNINFLDIGGEKIDFYLALKKNFKKINYFLFNQQSITKTFNEIKHKYNFKDLNIIEKENEIFEFNYDFVNFGSCIQYFENYESLLKEIAEISKFIFFSGTHLYNSTNHKFKENIIVKQVNLLPQVYYLYFFNRQKLFEIFLKRNFTLIFESQNLTDNVNYDNFKSYLKDIQYSDFLFEKK